MKNMLEDYSVREIAEFVDSIGGDADMLADLMSIRDGEEDEGDVVPESQDSDEVSPTAGADTDEISDEELDEFIYGDLYEDAEDEGVSADECDFRDAEDVHPAWPGEHGGRHGLVHEDKTPCDAQNEENCPEDKEHERADKIEFGKARKGESKGNRVTMLHDPEYLSFVSKLDTLKHTIRKWLLKHPEVDKNSHPYIQERRELTEEIRKAAENEKRRWTEESRHGAIIKRIWYSKGRKIVSQWDHNLGIWRTMYGEMTPRDAAEFKKEQLQKVKARQKVKPQIKTKRQVQSDNQIARAKRLGITRDIFAQFKPICGEELGYKKVPNAVFLKWLEDNGIPKTWKYGDLDPIAEREARKRREAQEAKNREVIAETQGTGSGGSEAFVLTPSMRARLASIAAAAIGETESNNGSKNDEQKGEVFHDQREKDAISDARNIAMMMKNRGRTAM